MFLKKRTAPTSCSNEDKSAETDYLNVSISPESGDFSTLLENSTTLFLMSLAAVIASAKLV